MRLIGIFQTSLTLSCFSFVSQCARSFAEAPALRGFVYALLVCSSAVLPALSKRVEHKLEDHYGPGPYGHRECPE